MTYPQGDTFSESWVETLCATMRLDMQHAPHLRSALNEAAWSWGGVLGRPEETPPIKKQYDELTTLSMQATALVKALRDLSQSAWVSMDEICDNLNLAPHRSRIEMIVDDKSTPFEADAPLIPSIRLSGATPRRSPLWSCWKRYEDLPLRQATHR